jgi:ubiquitin carboxyl-terminal hydrolase 4/11/15
MNDIEPDNSYYYLNSKQREFYNQQEQEFTIEITWLDQYIQHLKKLNEKSDFELPIKKEENDKSIDITSCYKNFVKTEKLEENNEWYCGQCKKHQRATKKMEIYKSPHILIIHLKRFRNNSKIDAVVDFPINGLNISNYVISKDENLSMMYDLFAIGNHYGSMGFGHYISFAKNPIDNKWYEFDDSHVSRKTENDLITSSAYVLFYRISL